MEKKNEPAEDWNKFFENSEDGKPAWIASFDEEHWLVKTKKGIFKLQELEWDKIDKARKRNEKAPQETVLSESIVGLDGKPYTVGELEIRTWKGSIVMRLLAAINTIYEVSDFLQE